jgi:1-phosphatidylinositol-4-phosphate 5-kinase
MLKTISPGEFHNLRDILKDYYDHLAVYPHTLITRFFGLHKIKYAKSNGGKARIYFVIMANVFKTSREIHVRYDLKGSTQGRKTKKNANEFIDPSVALKDLDFTDERMKVRVSPDI